MNTSIDEILAHVATRSALQEVSGPGFSGAKLELVTLDDGTRLVIKHISPRWDLAMRGTQDPGRAALLWTSGALDRLPANVDHAIVAAAREGDGWVIIMRDVSGALLSPERKLSRSEFHRVFRSIRDMHLVYRGTRIDDLCSLTTHLKAFTPATMTQFLDSGEWLPGMLLRGWELFDDIVPAEVAGAIRAVHSNPDALAAEMEHSWTTVVHGDLWLANLGIYPERIVILDWALATNAPPAFEFTTFLTGCWSRVEATREEMIDDIRAIYGDDHDERALQLAFIATFAEYGWNKALDVVDNPDPALREREADELAWWIATVRRALETTWSPV